jgi:cysteine desulfurase
MGFTHTMLPVDRCGMLSPADFAATLTDETIVASLMYANNEVGTITPLAKLSRIAHERGVLVHTDAVQAASQLSLDVQMLGVDLLSISAHKFYGPKGVGVLYCRDGVELVPSQSGGSHEDGRRAGTHNTAFIVGLAKALELAYAEFDTHVAHYRAMRDRLIDGVLDRVPDVHLTGHAEKRLPGHASFVLPGIDSSMLLMHLDMQGVAASGGSACKTGNPEPSNVLLAMGYSHEEAIGTLRLTVGRSTTADDIDYAVGAVAESVEKIRSLMRMRS